MPYWIYIKRANGVKSAHRSFVELQKAIDFVQNERDIWQVQGFPIPEYTIYYGSELVYPMEAQK
jgi:hypothetical protein